MEKQKAITKTFYWDLVKQKTNFKVIPARSLLNELEIELTVEEWENIFVQIFSVTNSVRLRMFQYNILNGLLVTNVKRAKYTQDLSPKCTFCKEKDETVIHLLIDCPMVEKLWVSLIKWIRYI